MSRRVLALVLVVAIGLMLAPTSPVVAAPVQAGEADAVTRDDRPVVYLTFDSGPGPRTPEFLDVLDRWNATATFFVIGRNAQTNPQMLAEIARRGHALGNHTWTHRNLGELTPLEAEVELHATNRIVAETVGVDMRCWRPPFGETTEALNEVAARVGLDNNSWDPSGRWDVDTVDWKYGYEFVLSRLQTIEAGDVVLMHGGMNPDHEDLAALMTWLEEHGDRYRFEALPGCEPTEAANARATSPAARDSKPGRLKSDPNVWFAIEQGSTYLGAFGSTRPTFTPASGTPQPTSASSIS